MDNSLLISPESVAILPASPLSPQDCEALRLAKARLETPGLAIRLSDLLGRPLEMLLLRAYKISPRLRQRIESSGETLMMKSLEAAIDTLGRSGAVTSPHLWTHRLATAASGLASGFFGLPGALADLPLTTGIILRSLAEIARSEGLDLDHLETRLDCLMVFALGGRVSGDDAAESGYWVTRAALGAMVTDAARHVAQKGLSEKGAPVLVRLVTAIASRFSVTLSEELAAKMVPVVGAASGAAINLIFIEHYQTVGRGHFTIRRLEKHYGSAAVEEEYRRIEIKPLQRR